MPEIPEETEITILPEFNNEKWYNTPRPSRNQKKTNNKMAAQNSPIVQPVTPLSEEITPTDGVPAASVPMITQDEEEILQTIPRGLGFPRTMPGKQPQPPRRSM